MDVDALMNEVASIERATLDQEREVKRTEEKWKRACEYEEEIPVISKYTIRKSRLQRLFSIEAPELLTHFDVFAPHAIHFGIAPDVWDGVPLLERKRIREILRRYRSEWW